MEELALNIRPIRIDDAPAMHAMRIMPGVQETTSAVCSERITGSEEFIRSLGDFDYHFVAEVETRQVVASVGLHVDKRPRKRHMGTLGIMVHTEWQRKGIGTRLMQYMLDFADNWLMLPRIELIVFASNEHAVKLYQSFGFEIEGRLRAASVMNGAYVDELVMGRVV